MNQDISEVNFNLALISYQNENFNEATGYAKKVTKLQSDDLDALDLLIEIHHALNEFDSSLQIIEKSHSKNPGTRTSLIKAWEIIISVLN